MKKIMLIFLIILLLQSCQSRGGFVNDTRPELVSDYSYFVKEIDKYLARKGSSLLRCQEKRRRFNVNFTDDYNVIMASIWLDMDLLDNSFEITCYLHFAKQQTLPLNIDVNFITELFNCFSENKIDATFFVDFFLADDSKYRAEDYEKIMGQTLSSYGETIVSSYKYSAVDKDNYMSLITTDNTRATLLIASKLDATKIEKNVENAVNLIESASCVNWFYEVTEIYTAQLAENSQLELIISSPHATKSIMLDPDKTSFHLNYMNKLERLADERKYLDPNIFLQILEILVPELLTSGELTEFLESEENYYLYWPPGYVVVKRAVIEGQYPCTLYYFLKDDLSEELCFSLSILDNWRWVE